MSHSFTRSACLLLLAVSALAQAQQPVADAGDDEQEMAAARAALKASHGGQVTGLVLGERFEYHSNDDLWALEGQGWVGGDIQKLWFKTDAESGNETQAGEDSRAEEAELQLLYSRAVAPFWDLQTGLRQDLTPDPARTYLAIGTQGLAPHWFEVDTALFFSHKGDLSARLEVEYELRLSQRLVLQPRVELNAALSDDKSIAAGLQSAEAGLRLRYEVLPTFAPYLGVSWSRTFGRTADLRDTDGKEVSLVAGVRFWF